MKGDIASECFGGPNDGEWIVHSKHSIAITVPVLDSQGNDADGLDEGQNVTILLTFEGAGDSTGPCFGLWSGRLIWGVW